MVNRDNKESKYVRIGESGDLFEVIRGIEENKKKKKSRIEKYILE